jgi:archaellum component FlaC
LRSTEEERDKLLRFVQADMQKSADLTRLVEKLEEELRSSKAELRSQKDCEELLSDQLEKVATLETQVKNLKDIEAELSADVLSLRTERERLQRELERKTIECDELTQSHLAKLKMVRLNSSQ